MLESMKILAFTILLCLSLNAQAQDSGPTSFTYDIGFSAGSINNENYSELNLGLNYFIQPWLAWRNAFFYRSIDPKSQYGLDTSLRLFGDIGSNKLGLTVFGGPGFRFITESKNAPFAEAGLVGHFGGLSLEYSLSLK